MGFLSGHIDITDNIQFVTDLIMNPVHGMVIINLDEDVRLKGDNVIGGAELLAPPDAMQAEVDGDEQLYDAIYLNYFNQPNINQYMMGIVHFLYEGGSIVMYYETLDINGSKTIAKLLNIIWMKYGIGVGIAGQAPGRFNEQYLPLWLSLLYQAGSIGVDQFLAQYPVGVAIDDSTMIRLIQEIHPYSADNRKYIYDLIKLRKQKPRVKQGIIGITN